MFFECGTRGSAAGAFSMACFEVDDRTNSKKSSFVEINLKHPPARAQALIRSETVAIVISIYISRPSMARFLMNPAVCPVVPPLEVSLSVAKQYHFGDFHGALTRCSSIMTRTLHLQLGTVVGLAFQKGSITQEERQDTMERRTARGDMTIKKSTTGVLFGGTQ